MKHLDTKRILSILLVVVLTVTLIPVNVSAEDAHAHDAACGYIEGADLTLTESPDATVSGGAVSPVITVEGGTMWIAPVPVAVPAGTDPITISADTTWTAGTLSATTLTVNPGVTLALTGTLAISGNVAITGGGTIKPGSNSGYNNGLIDLSDSASLTLENITLDGDKDNAVVVALVHVDSGVFTMKDGAALRNTSGFGVLVNGGAFNMQGGEISSNDNCGVYVYGFNNSEFIVGGTAKITGNGNSNKAYNVQLLNNKLITLGNGSNGVSVPSDGMSIGVTPASPPIAGSRVKIVDIPVGSAALPANAFFSDSNLYDVVVIQAAEYADGLVGLQVSAAAVDLRAAAKKDGTYQLTDNIDIADTESYNVSTADFKAGLYVSGNFTIDLNGHNLTINVNVLSNGIKIASGKTLTIRDSATGGTLTVNNNVQGSGGSDLGAGINTADGTLIIESGTIIAKGGDGGAGIGGGVRTDRGDGSVWSATGGTVTINGGTVTATGGAGDLGGGSAGIGGGAGFDGGNGGNGGTVTITGGTVTATGGTGIGTGGTLKITGGSVIIEGAGGTEATPKNGSDTNVYLATLTLKDVSAVTEVTALTAPDGYGIKDVNTDASGKLYFYLPEGTDTAVSLTANSTVYSGKVSPKADNTATASLTAAGQPDPTDASISPTTATFDKGSSSQTVISVTLTLNGRELSLVKSDSGKLEVDTDYVYVSDGSSGPVVTFKKAYLDTLSNGEHTITFEMDGGTNPTLELTVTDSTKTVMVGTQSGTLTAGTAGSATYTVTAANITSGTAITLNGAPAGVTLGTTATTGDSTTITINVTAAVPASTYPLTLTIDGTTSDSFNLVVGATPTYTLTAAAPSFSGITYGDAQPAAQSITITSTGNSDAAISGVTLTAGDTTGFVIGGSGSSVTAGGSIDTWTVQPAANLAAGEHNAIITVTYNDGVTATAAVSITVNRKYLTLKANNITIPIGAAEPAYTYIVGNLVGNDTAAVITTAPVFSLDRPFDSSTAGTFTIKISGGATTNPNYSIDMRESGRLTVTAKTLVTVSAAAADTTYIGSAYAGLASVSSGAFTGTLEYSYVGRNSTTYVASPTAPTNAGDYTVTIKVPDSNATYIGSASFDFTIGNATQAAPPVGKADETAAGNDGTITGVTLEMEYKKQGDSGYTAVTGTTITGLAPGTYLVRYAAKPNYNAGADASVTIAAYNAPTAYMITFNANGGYVSPTYTPTGLDGKPVYLPIPARSGSYSFDGWFTAANGGTQVTTDTVLAADITIYAHWTYTGGGSTTTPAPDPTPVPTPVSTPVSDGSGSTTTPVPDPTPVPTPVSTPVSDGSGSTTTPVPDPTSAPETSTINVGGKEVDAGAVTATGDTTTVTVNQDTMNRQIETAADNVTITVPAETGTAVVELVMQNVDDMAGKDVSLAVQAGNVRYELPAAAIDTASVLTALGADSGLDVTLSITVSTDVSPDIQATIDSVMAKNGGEVIVPPIEFKVTATHNGQTVEISTFNSYVSRSVEVTEEQARKITTAVVIRPDGTVRHVPTYTYQKDGKWYYAVVNSLTNSTYALIHNERAFADAAGKWYEAAANEMASRMIISGISDTEFGGDLPITRAELAVMLVRALGLPEDGDGTVFGDVSATAWYAGGVGKAYEYGLVNGMGNGDYAPGKYATHQEAMVMVRNAARVAKLIGATIRLDAFADAGIVSTWALEAVKWNVGTGLVSGSDGKLNPLDIITRAEAAILILKMLREAGLIDDRTQTERPIEAAAYAAADPRKEPDPMVVPDDPRKEPDPVAVADGNDDEDTGPDGDDKDGVTDSDSTGDSARADFMNAFDILVKAGARGEITVQEAVATLNSLSATYQSVTRI